MTSEPTNADHILLRPHEPVAERVLCTGDPGRALRLAQDLMEGTPRMLNHHRGLWGYSGTGIDGHALTVQGTGVGGPSAAAVVHELCALGAQRVVRVGSATAIGAPVRPADLVAVTVAIALDGTSRALGAGAEVPADPELTNALAAGADHAGHVASTDLLHPPAGIAGPDALAWDLQTAALLVAAVLAGARAGAVLLIAARGDERLGGEELLAAERRAGRLGLAALGV